MLKRVFSASFVPLLFACGMCSGQVAGNGKKLEFEVATTRLVPSRSPVGYAPGVKDGRFSASNITLKGLLAYAYGVLDFQITGPGWLDKEAYDIVAIVPEGATRDQVPAMVRSLLEERLKVVTHRDQVEMNVYNLVVTNPKVEIPVFDPADYMNNHGLRIPPGAAMAGGTGTMAHFGDILAKIVGRPVLDKTGLTGTRYQLDVAYDDGQRGPTEAPSLSIALQERFGLRLEAGKGMVERVVVDSAERVPAEN